jgi:hypothetical protein
MAPGHSRRILVREMFVLEYIQRHFLILRPRCRGSAVEGLGRRRRQVAVPRRGTFAGSTCPNTFGSHEERAA